MTEILRVRIQSPSLEAPMTLEIERDASVQALKYLIQANFPYSPSPNDQRVIFEGRLLTDQETLTTLLRKHEGNFEPTFHVVVKPSLKNAPARLSSSTDPLSPSTSLPSQASESVQRPTSNPYPAMQQAAPALHSPTLPGGYQVVMINGQCYLAPVYVLTTPLNGIQTGQLHDIPQPQTAYSSSGPVPVATPQSRAAEPPASSEFAFRTAVRATSIWLALKLMILLVIMCQGASIERIIIFHAVALVYFLYQTGRLQLVVRRVQLDDVGGVQEEPRREESIPDRTVPSHQTAPTESTSTSSSTAPATASREPTSPGTAAVHSTPSTVLETLKRGAYIFLASLWPNYHSDHVAQGFDNGEQEPMIF